MRVGAAVLIGLAAVCQTPATAGIFGPSNYDDCILENMKGVGDKWAAYHVVQACRSKFPEKKVVEKPVKQAMPAPAVPVGKVGPECKGPGPITFDCLLPE